MSLSLVELKQVIELSDFDKVLGEIEGQCLDAKEQPYRFEDGSDIKREFAKDVSAFANSRGGAILVGLRTKTGPFQYGEEVEIIRPIPVAFFDPDQHRKILAEWLYPQPIGIEIVFKPFGNDPNKGSRGNLRTSSRRPHETIPDKASNRRNEENQRTSYRLRGASS